MSLCSAFGISLCSWDSTSYSWVCVVKLCFYFALDLTFHNIYWGDFFPLHFRGFDHETPLWTFTAVITGFSGWKAGNALHSWPSFMILAVICGRYFLSAAFQTPFYSSTANSIFCFWTVSPSPGVSIGFVPLELTLAAHRLQQSRTDGIFGKLNNPKGSFCISQQGLHAYRLVIILRGSLREGWLWWFTAAMPKQPQGKCTVCTS